MTSLSARRLVPACILSAVTAAAFIAPGAANASLGEQCSGSNVTGQGSTLQKLAQVSVWDGDFNTTTATRACSGAQGSKGKPEVKYNSTGSGAGLESWGANKSATTNFGATNAWVSTDEPPDSTQIAEIESHGRTEISDPGTVLTVPVLQGAISIIVNLPAGCEGASKVNAHRIVLNNVTLEAIYRGTITKWSEITDNEDKLSAQKGKTCNPETLIVPVVRRDGSGTTHIFKKYLGLINKGGFETEKGETKNWNEISEGSENTTWPKGVVTKETGEGGGALVKTVAETPSSIGYANLADARSNKSFTPPTGGPFTSRFWVELQNNGTATTGTITYAEPSTNGESEGTANANCASTEYTNGEEVPFPPASVTEPWNEVTTSTTEKNYTLCGLTYALSLHSYAKYPGTTLQEATTVENFLYYVLGVGPQGGQTLVANHDYLALPSGPVLTEATSGVEKIRY